MAEPSNKELTEQNGQRSPESGEMTIETSPNNRYSKLNVILGKGAYKVVWKALDRQEGFEVAWNCCQTTKAEFVEFSQEIDILKKVRHPNIINFHDSWFQNNEFVFITELMTSGTLREYIRKLKMPNLKIIKRWSRQILKGLQYLHSHNPPIIHRDIKCDNIFINGAHGEVKIGDMGSAKMKLGKKYTVIGTPEFMAPEMYEEKGYNEKVDVYAFGMCLLEMATGEYPYSECKNAAQIYKKVSQGVKPECLSKVTDTEVLELINSCIANENDRITVSSILEHAFLGEDPEVILTAMDDTRTHLTLQVVFRGTDKLSVKFEFNSTTDTAEEVVHEMIEENVLAEKYRSLVTFEINRMLRQLSKPETMESILTHLMIDPEKEEEFKRIKQESDELSERLEAAEIRLKENDAYIQQLRRENELLRANSKEEKNELISSPSSQSFNSPDITGRRVSASQGSAEYFDFEGPITEYSDDRAIEDLVMDTAIATHRGNDKAVEWLKKLKSQDIMTIGDLRELHDEDWGNLNLTVFAARALRNALYGRANARTLIASPKSVAVRLPNNLEL